MSTHRTGSWIAAACAALAAACAAAVAQDAAAPAAVPEKLAYVGRVLDEDGRPVAGAAVWADNGGPYQVVELYDDVPWRDFVPDPLRAGKMGPYAVRGAAPSGGDGRFRVDGVAPPAGEGFVLVAHPAHVVGVKHATGVPARGGVVDVGDVVLAAGRTLGVTVRRPDGSPVGGAWVVARPAAAVPALGIAWSGETPGEARADRTHDPRSILGARARVAGLRPVKYRVAAFDDVSAPTEVEVDLSGASPPGSVEITLRDGGRVRLEVVSRETGRPLAGATVRVERPNDTGGFSMPGPAPLASRTTGEDGVVEVAGMEPFDAYDVTVGPPDTAADAVHHPTAFSVRRRVANGGTERVALDEPIAVGIAVCDARTRKAVAGVRLRARPDWPRYDATGGRPVEVAGVAEGELVVLLRGIRPGPWLLDVAAPGYLPQTVGPVELRHTYQSTDWIGLEPATAAASGRIVERATGRPVAGARVEAYEWMRTALDGNRADATTAADGAFRLGGLLGAGFPLRLEVTAPGFCAEVRGWEAEARPAVDVGEIALVRAATVRGRLTDADGRPLAQQEVQLVSADNPGRMSKSDGVAVTTDADGRFVFDGLRPGAYVLVGQDRSSPIVLAEGATAVRDLTR